MNWEINRGITDFIVCRKCARKIKDRNLTGHARRHGYKRVGYYLADYPDAPTVIPEKAEKQRRAHAELRTKVAKAERIISEAVGSVARARRKGYTPEEIRKAIEAVRKVPYVSNRTAREALNISEAGLHRWLSEGKLKRYKKGFVYSAQIIRILDRSLATVS